MRDAFVILAVFAGLATGAQAQGAGSTTAATEPTDVRHALSAQDLAFVREAASAGHSEAQAGTLALTQSQNRAVRNFGLQLRNDQGDADRSLELITMTLNLTPPSHPLPKAEAQLRGLEQSSGSAFDQAFLQQNGVSGFKKTIAIFKREASSATASAPLRRFAQQALPVLRAHLTRAQQLQRQLQAQAGRVRLVAGSAPAFASLGPTLPWTRSQPQHELELALRVVHHMKVTPDLSLTLQRASGVFILPAYGRGDQSLSFRSGEGVLVTHHSGQFSGPAFYHVGSVNLGAQTGGPGDAVAYLLMSRKAVRQFLLPGHFALNADAGLKIVAWPDRAHAFSGGGVDVMAWSDAKGATLGITDIWADNQANHRYYGRSNANPREILSGGVQNPHGDVLGRVLAT